MEWKTVKLGDISTVQTGPFGSQLHQRDYVAQGTPCIMPTNIGYNLNIVTNNIAFLKEEDVLRLKRHVVEEGDIVYSRRGDIEKCAYIDTAQVGWFCGTGCLRIRPNKDKVVPRYLAYKLSMSESKKWIVGNAVGTTMLNLSASILNEMPLSIPSLETQRRIAAILSSLDDKIENNNRINRNLEAQAQALFKSWFVDFEPWGGTMPDDWKEGTLGDIIDEQPKSKVQVNAAKDVRGKYPFFTSGTSIYEYNEALVSGRNVFLNTGGAAGIEFYVGEASYSTDTWCIKGIDNFTDYLYLYLLSILNIINTEYFEGSALKHLKKKPLKERKIIIPTHKTIDDLNKMVVPLFDIIMENYSENKRLAALRDTLLPKLMKGEIAL